MKKYLVLYRSTVSAVEQLGKATPDQAKAGMEAWMAWAKRAGSGIVDLGHPVGNPHYFSGTPSATNTHVTGFSILQAEDEGALRLLLIGHPHIHVPGNSIEAFEFLAIPGSA